MADPVSLVGLVLAVGSVAQTILSYALAAKDASRDINGLLTELLAVKGFLDQLQSDRQKNEGNRELPGFTELLQSGIQVIRNLEDDFQQPVSKIRGVVRQLKWPLKKQDVNKHIERLERLKTYCLLILVRQSSHHEADIKEQVQYLGNILREERNERQASKLDETREKVLLWMAPVDTEAVHVSAHERHHEGTNSWLIKGQLLDLINSEPDISTALWLKGKSGSGKTVVISQVIEYLKEIAAKDDRIGLAYFYCTFDHQQSHEPRNILGSLLAQLSKQVPAIFELVQADLERFQSMSTEDLVGVFLETLTSCSTELSALYIVIDAVNESAKASDIAVMLVGLSRSSSRFRFLFSSIENSRPCDAWNGCRLISTEMDSSTVNCDIQAYVSHQLAHNPLLSRYTRSLRADINEAVLKLSDGNFRYARWQMEHLAAQPTGRHVRKMLQTLPHNLNESYSQFLNNTPLGSPERRYLRKALLWLCFAPRPLRLPELAEAVVLEDGDAGLSSDDRLSDAELLVRLSHGVIDYDRFTGIVSLAHFSVRTCLTSEWIKSSPIADFAVSESSAHDAMLQDCLTYLLFDEFSSGYVHSATPSFYLHSKYPLLAYAADNWTCHLRAPYDGQGDLLLRFLATRKDHNAGSYGHWMSCILRLNIPVKSVQSSHPLYYASSLGIASLVKAIIELDPTADVDAPGGMKGSRPIHVASFRRREEVVRMLIEAGADPLAEDPGMGKSSGVTAISWAKSNGWEEVLALIEKMHPGSTIGEDAFWFDN